MSFVARADSSPRSPVRTAPGRARSFERCCGALMSLAERSRSTAATSATLSYAELAREVAVVPQREEAAFPTRVREYVALGRYPHLGLWRAPAGEDDRAVDQALAQAV